MVFGYFLSYDTAPIVGATIAFVILAIPSMLAGAYSGLESVDRDTIDAARANGMTEWQILTQVEIPLGLPLIVGGVRAAVLQVIATVTIASYAGLGGLGRIITSGIGLNDYDRDPRRCAPRHRPRPRWSTGSSPLAPAAHRHQGPPRHPPRGTSPHPVGHHGRRRVTTRQTKGNTRHDHQLPHDRVGALALAARPRPPRSPRAAPPTPPHPAAVAATATRSSSAPSRSPRARSWARSTPRRSRPRASTSTTKFNIGPRQQTIPALQDGSINLIPEYNGNLLAYYNPDYTERTTEEVDGALRRRRGRRQAAGARLGRGRGQGRLRRHQRDRRGQRPDLDRRPVRARAVLARLEPAVRRARLRHPGPARASTASAPRRATSPSCRSRTSAAPTPSRRSSTTPSRSPTSTPPRRPWSPRTSWSSRTRRT